MNNAGKRLWSQHKTSQGTLERQLLNTRWGAVAHEQRPPSRSMLCNNLNVHKRRSGFMLTCPSSRDRMGVSGHVWIGMNCLKIPSLLLCLLSNVLPLIEIRRKNLVCHTLYCKTRVQWRNLIKVILLLKNTHTNFKASLERDVTMAWTWIDHCWCSRGLS